jgi:hypothetical protein
MKIDKEFIKKAGIETDFNEDILLASLFILAKNNTRVKQIKWEIDSLEYQEKLQRYKTEHRFIILVEVSNVIYAQVHAQAAERLKASKDLTIENKKVVVQTLTEEQAKKFESAIEERLTALFIQQDKKKEKPETEKRSERREFFASSRLLSDTIIAKPLSYALMFKEKALAIGRRVLEAWREILQTEAEKTQQHEKKVAEQRREQKKEILVGEIRSGERRASERTQEVIRKEIK